MSLEPNYGPDAGTWRCGCCGGELTQEKQQVFYLESAFDVVLPRCVACGLTLVPKSLALGRMVDVESLLEDK